jgi:hypothetical protein
MKQKGEGMWIDWDAIPKRYRDWLVNEVGDLFCLHRLSH